MNINSLLYLSVAALLATSCSEDNKPTVADIQGVYAGYSFERRRQRQRAVECGDILEGSVFDVGHAFRNVELSGKSACMEGRTSDLL